MDKLAQEAVLIGLARRLDEHGSWSGETHLQKAAYLLHELLDVQFGFDFILYKHGPFSRLAAVPGEAARRGRDRPPQGWQPPSRAHRGGARLP